MLFVRLANCCSLPIEPERLVTPPPNPLTIDMTDIGLIGMAELTPVRFSNGSAAPNDGECIKLAAISASVAYVWSSVAYCCNCVR
jgi:hypothetical protein